MSEFQVTGSNANALFTLKIHRGDGMALVAMNWKSDETPPDFVGFAIEYKEPEGNRFFTLKNRIAFPGAGGKPNPKKLTTRQSPIQKFRWVHFPRSAEMEGDFVYRVTPVFMNDEDGLSYGEPQKAEIELRRETYPRPTQCHLHTRVRVIAGLRRPIRIGWRDFTPLYRGRRRRVSHLNRPIRRRRGRSGVDGLRSA